MASLRTLGCALALTVSTVALTGCMTALTPAKETADVVPADPREGVADATQPAEGGAGDQQVAALGGAENAAAPTDADPTTANAMMPMPNQGQAGSIVLQTTGLQATSSSIFASKPAGMIQPQAAMPTGAGQPGLPPQQGGVAPASNSLFRTEATPAQPLPLEGAENATAQKPIEVASADDTSLPPGVPVPTGAGSGRSDARASGAQHVSGTGLFAAAEKTRGATGKPGSGDSLPLQVAALGYAALPGIRSRSMFATVDDAAPEHDDASAAIEVAALPGLARLAPNGLWLQTESVEAGCFQPELMQMLKSVEGHYGRKILVTSGRRDVEHNRRVGGSPQSLHTSCRAADIQVPGVSKWDLAQYLRALPGRGGVGTYCHTASVHIDTGRFRDWNWPCPRRDA